MTRAQIAALALAKLDEISPYDTSDVIPSAALADKLMDESAKTMLRSVPLHLVKPKNLTILSPNHVYDNTTGVGHIVLPTDYLRLYSFKLTEWSRSISVAITEQHPLFNLQKSRITRGKPNKPVCVLRHAMTTLPLTVGTLNQDPVIWEDDTENGYLYLGYSAIVPNAELLENMVIKRIDTENNTIYYAEGNLTFDKVWDDRATYDYTPLTTDAEDEDAPTLGMILEYYSSNVTASNTLPDIDTALYVATEKPEDLNNTLSDLLTWFLAYDISVSMGEVNRINLIKTKISEITQSAMLTP